MELTGALLNLPVKVRQAADLRKRLLGGARRPVQKPEPLKPRQGSVREIVKHVLLIADKPLKIKEIHRACEQQLGRSVPYSTVADTLRETRTITPVFTRVSYGTYELHKDQPSYGLQLMRRRHPGR